MAGWGSLEIPWSNQKDQVVPRARVKKRVTKAIVKRKDVLFFSPMGAGGAGDQLTCKEQWGDGHDLYHGRSHGCTGIYICQNSPNSILKNCTSHCMEIFPKTS